MIPTKCMPSPGEGRGVTSVDLLYLKMLEDRICIAPSAIVALLVANIEVSDACMHASL